jgi:FMN phosphatase YigB (HAD superfamily)
MVSSFQYNSKKYLLKTKRMMPGAIDIVKYLHNKGYILGIISDTNNNKPKNGLKKQILILILRLLFFLVMLGEKKEPISHL